MNIITGPRRTAAQRGDLAEAAGLHDARIIDDFTEWARVTDFYVLPGWDTCPTATADVQIALATGLAIKYFDEH